MDQLVFLQDLAVVMAVSAVIIILFRRLRLPVVLGYILAGLLIGPNTPPYPLVRDLHSIHILSELGVIFLLFSIGLEFSLSRLAKVGLVAAFAAAVEILLMLGVGYAMGRFFGWSRMDSVFLGAILSISSTTIIAKLLLEMKRVKERFAQVILGILVIEDLLAIVLIALLSGVASTGSLEMGDAGRAMARVFAFVGGVLFLGMLAVPRLLRHLERSGSDEMRVITVLGLCFGVSLAAAQLGFSVALGAFLIGAVIAETKQVKEVLRDIEPIRDMFTAIFFVSVGMLLSPGTLREHWQPILLLTLVTIVGKLFSCTAATFFMGYSKETALMVGLGLAQIGEFSFIIARLGETSGVTSPFLFPIAVAVSGVTTLTTPFLMRNTGPIIELATRVTPRPLATVLGLYTGWFGRIATSPSERKALLVRGFRFYAPRTAVYAAVVLSVYFGLSWAQGRFAMLPTHVYHLAVAALFAVAVSTFVYVYLWGSMSRTHERIERMVLGVFGNEQAAGKPAAAARHELVKLIQQEYPWEVKTEDFLLPYQESAVNRPIKDLRLRSETGASIVAIYRDEEALANPSPETRLSPGDVLLLMGDEAQIAAAIRYLTGLLRQPPPAPRAEGPPKTIAFEVATGLPCVGKTLNELKLRRRTGASVLGIQKEGVSVNNPDPETVLEAGDVLALFGLPEQLERAVRYLSAPPA